MNKGELEAVAETLRRIANPDMKPKDLLKAVREAHPKASKKDIVRAAFYSIITDGDADPGKAKTLQDFAIKERGG